MRFYLSIFYFRQLPSELTEWHSTKTCHMFESGCDLKMHVQNVGYPLPYNWELQTTYFRRFSTTSQLKGLIYNGQYLRTKTWPALFIWALCLK